MASHSELIATIHHGLTSSRRQAVLDGLEALDGLVEQLEAAQGVLCLLIECEDALMESGYSYLTEAAEEALGSSPASEPLSDAEAIRRVKKHTHPVSNQESKP